MTSKGLLVGINYLGTSNELGGCINDIYNVEKMLLGSGYHSNDIVKLYDTPTHDSSHEPTTSSILQHIDDTIKSFHPERDGECSFVFHFSGHGGQTYDLNKDERDNMDETIYTVDGLINDDVLKERLVDSLPEEVKLRAIFDCCHSGSCLDLPYRWKNGDKFVIENRSTSSRDVVMISGCMDNQTSADAWIKENARTEGAMTWAYLKAIEYGKQYHNDISWKELIQHMRFSLKESRYVQIPQLNSSSKLNIKKGVEFCRQ